MFLLQNIMEEQVPKTHPMLRDREWLEQRYVKDYRTVKEIGSELGVSDGAVVRAMQRLGVQSRSPQAARAARGIKIPRRIAQLNDAEWLRRKYVDDELSQDEIAAEIGCSRGAVLKAMRAHGIPMRKPGLIRGDRTRADVIPQLRDTNWLQVEYVEKERSAESIATELGCSTWTVATMLSRWRIKRYPERNLEKRDASLGRGKKRGWKGYIEVYMPDHPAAKGSGYVAEHRLKAEEALGRHLTKAEVVHHINEKTDDNRESNFIVFESDAAHRRFHNNPPAWIPRCPCCGRPTPEKVEKRPDDVPLLWNDG